MSRPKKATVDYFPHQCNHKSTVFILEQKYGNDGYAFWFKLLELLGSSENHFIDCNNIAKWEFLQAITKTDNGICIEILTLLSKLDAIDADLWKNKIVWSQNFVDGIADVYKNRRVGIPTKPDFYRQESTIDSVSTDNPLYPTDINPQTKLKETKLKETKLKETKLKETKKENGVKFQKPTMDEIFTYCNQRKNIVDPQMFFDFYESKGWMIGKNKMKDWRAAVRTWEKGKNTSSSNYLQGAREFINDIEGER